MTDLPLPRNGPEPPWLGGPRTAVPGGAAGFGLAGIGGGEDVPGCSSGSFLCSGIWDILLECNSLFGHAEPRVLECLSRSSLQLYRSLVEAQDVFQGRGVVVPNPHHRSVGPFDRRSMMSKGSGFAAGFWILLLLVAAGNLSGMTYYGCMKCNNNSLVGFGGYCVSVGHEQHGDGTRCDQINTGLPWPNNTDCSIGGSPCYNEVVTDGGGGGGGGSACGTTGFCPAECFSCAGSGGRPAV